MRDGRWFNRPAIPLTRVQEQEEALSEFWYAIAAIGVGVTALALKYGIPLLS